MGTSLEKSECLPLTPAIDEAYNVVELLDGRQLAFREYGDPCGVPVVFYHGSLSSRLFMPSWDETHEAAAAAGARVIAMDRPGYGRSSAQSGRAYMDNGAELRALLASAGLAAQQRVALLGHGSGAPHALAAAYVTTVPGVPCQVSVVGLVSPEGPYLEVAPCVAASAHEAAAATAAAYENLCAACEELWDTWPERSRFLAADLSEATRQGCGAAEQDYTLERSAWDFCLEDVCCRCLLWQGNAAPEEGLAEAGPGAPVARHLAARLPDCQAEFVRAETHLLIRRRWEDILGALTKEFHHLRGSAGAGHTRTLPPPAALRPTGVLPGGELALQAHGVLTPRQA